MLRLEGVQAECLFDEVLPAEVRELPKDLARLDELLSDPAILAPIEGHWRREAERHGRSAAAHGRPTIPMAAQRLRGEKISGRIVSIADPDARPIRKGKAGKPNEFGYVAQIREVTQNTKPGARGFVLPAASGAGNLGENTLLPQTAAEFQDLGLAPREVALDGGFGHHRSEEQLAALESDRVFVSGRQEPGSARTKRRLRCYRTGIEGRISHLKRGYGLSRSRLKGLEGQRIWSTWAILAYDLDTFAVLTR